MIFCDSHHQGLDPYLVFSRQEWSQLQPDRPLVLNQEQLAAISGVNEAISKEEVAQVYLPLARLLYCYYRHFLSLQAARSEFFAKSSPKVPFIIGIAGSVAVGKSTTSRIIQALLSHWLDQGVQVVTTDGFLYPTATLEEMGILQRKGFPDSYDLAALLQFLFDLKSGKKALRAPVYSHHLYDIVPGEYVVIDQPDIVIVEGLNILQTGGAAASGHKVFVSDFLDFSIFVDACTQDIEQWFIDRVLTFTKGPFLKPDAYFHFLTKLRQEEVVQYAARVWREINEQNLTENMLPFKYRAKLILHKNPDHQVSRLYLRK